MRDIAAKPTGALRAPSISDRQTFGAVSLIAVIGSALLAGFFPLWFSIATVMAFGVPHNWAEYRYFLSRLPSKLGPLRPFFFTSFAGLAFLFISEAAMVMLYSQDKISSSTAGLLLLSWNQLLIAWILALSLLRYPQTSFTGAVPNVVLALLTSVANVFSPQILTLSLTYLHPLLGLWILDRELRRSRKSWLRTYHRCLLAVPVGVICLGVTLQSACPATAISRLAAPLHVGAQFFTDASPTMLISVYAFLQMVHYAVWLFAIPIATRGWKRWRVDRLAVLRNKPALRALVGPAIACSVIALPAFWLGLKLDYATTIEIYVILSLAHVLAEIPFLFWMSES